MKVLVGTNDMGGFPWLYPFRPGEDDPRRTVEVPKDLYERLVGVHEEFCAILNTVHVECLEIRDAPDPEPVRLLHTRVYPEGRYSGEPGFDGYRARCEVCGLTTAVRSALGEEKHDRALAEVLRYGWRERRYGGLACPEHAPGEKVEVRRELVGGAWRPTFGRPEWTHLSQADVTALLGGAISGEVLPEPETPQTSRQTERTEAS